jgi:histidine triad (HIT) family protein
VLFVFQKETTRRGVVKKVSKHWKTSGDRYTAPMNIFEKIISREIPATLVYEDNDTLAFMDIRPIIKGHTLVVPKTCYDPVTETPDDVLAKLMLVCKRIAAAQIKSLGADGVNIIQNNGASAGQVVPHIHFHVIPRFEGDGHHWNWAAKTYDSPSEIETFAAKIREGLNG